MIAEVTATVSAGIFAGAAIYINLVEQPARLSCGPELAVAQWRPSYKRGAMMQAPLAVVGSLLALASWWAGGGATWLLGGLLLLAVVPITLVVIMPTNRRLQSETLDRSSAEAERLLRRWGGLHALRSALSLLAFLSFLLALGGRS